MIKESELAELAQKLIRDQAQHWTLIEAADRAEDGYDLAWALLGYLGVKHKPCPDDCESCKENAVNLGE